MRKPPKIFNFCEAAKQYFKLTPYTDIITWAKTNIDFSGDISAERNRLDFDQYPYQIAPIKAWEFSGQKEVVVVAPEQTGKTNTFLVGYLYHMIFNPCQSMIVYPNDSLAVETNQTKITPLMRKIPQLKNELDKPRSFRGDRYSFSNLVSYFQGSGAKVVSKSCKIRIGDEIDAWDKISSINNVSELRKRGRSYKDSILYLVCTPSFVNGKIWTEFLRSSQGYWHLRCQGCHELTMRSCDIHNLQFESVYNEELKYHIVEPESIVLQCPKCGYQHTEDQKKIMNIFGDYIHVNKSLIDKKPGFQWGALASQLESLSWEKIAQAQLDAGKTADLDEQMTLDNSIRGLPFKRREVAKDEIEKVKEHCWTNPPCIDNIEMIYVISDTQDDHSPTGVFAVDTNDNMYLLEFHFCPYLFLTPDDRTKQESIIKEELKVTGQPFNPIVTVEDLLNKEYLITNGVGIKPTFALIDRQGHKSDEVQHFANKKPNVFMYQGTGLQMNFKISETNNKLILANAKHYQTELIYYLYSQKKKDSSYLYFYPEINEKVLTQIRAVKPDSEKRNGHAPENWEALNGAVHDAFDVLKMSYLAYDWAIQTFRSDRWRYRKSPRLQRRYESTIKQMERFQQTNAEQTQKSWFKD